DPVPIRRIQPKRAHKDVANGKSVPVVAGPLSYPLLPLVAGVAVLLGLTEVRNEVWARPPWLPAVVLLTRLGPELVPVGCEFVPGYTRNPDWPEAPGAGGVGEVVAFVRGPDEHGLPVPTDREPPVGRTVAVGCARDPILDAGAGGASESVELADLSDPVALQHL